MRRFLVPSDLITGSTVPLAGDLYRHMITVLRLQPGDDVILCNGEGTDFHATIQDTGAKTFSLKIIDSTTTAPDSLTTLSLTLIQGLPKSDKFDFIIQKATELGISSIVAFPAAHSVVRLAPDQVESRLSRWNRITAEASRQSERNSIPSVSLAKNLDSALRDAQESVKLFFLERERGSKLKDLLTGTSRPPAVALLVGPEGGFSADEVSIATTRGFTPVSLGERILRTETASLAAIALLQYQWGDMG